MVSDDFLFAPGARVLEGKDNNFKTLYNIDSLPVESVLAPLTIRECTAAPVDVNP